MRSRWQVVAVAVLAGLPAACGVRTGAESGDLSSSTASDYQAASTIEQIIPADRLQKIRTALPKVAFPKLQAILESPQTFWYDHDTMTPSYQDSLGAQANSKWPNLVAAGNDVISGLHDRQKKRWQFPFGTTAGTDDSSNFEIVNFVHIPHEVGKPLSIPIWQVRRNYNRPQWNWVYPNDTMFGEIIFVTDGATLLPSEIRIRTRHPGGWSTNVFRPFPRAADLAAGVKARRADWQSRPNLDRLVKHLENDASLTPKTLAGKAALKSTFEQAGALDVLPDFGDEGLVKELLTTTTFVSAYGATWKAAAGQKTYAASTSSALSIVPTNYEAGIFEVNETSCMRCHKETGRLVSEFYGALYLYGELWGKDGIFSFHPFDESRYPSLRAGDENRSVNPRLKAMGVFETYDANKHTEPRYPKRP